MSMCKDIPQDVVIFLTEGNSKYDLLEWIWDLLSEDEKAKTIEEAKQSQVDESIGPWSTPEDPIKVSS